MSVAAMFEEAVRVPVARRCTATVLQLDRYRPERSGRSNLPKTAKVPQITEIGGRIGTPDLLRASRGRRGARRSGSRPRSLGNSYVALRYEDLLYRPEEELGRLLEFLGAYANEWTIS